MPTKTSFQDIVAQLSALTEMLKRPADANEKRALLKEFRTLLGKADARTFETTRIELALQLWPTMRASISKGRSKDQSPTGSAGPAVSEARDSSGTARKT